MATTTGGQPDALKRLREHFLPAQGTLEHGRKWDDLYKDGFMPWDKGFPSPALVDLLTDRQDLFPSSSLPDGRRRKALVAGCGKGYDVLLLSAFGYDAYGLELSEKALEEARKTESECAGKGVYETREGRETGTIRWLSGDFFGDGFLNDVEGEEKKFDVFYDYTFMCALPPVMRPQWSKRYNDLMTTDGRLVCLEFPTYKDPSTGGPPWASPPKIYEAHLPRPGEELAYDENGVLLEEKLGEPSKNGLQRLAHFQPKRTHAIGVNSEGKVTDWVGVWAHST